MCDEEKRALIRKEYLKKIWRNRILISIARWGILVLLIALWELAARMNWIDPFITSSPSRIFICATNLFYNDNLMYHIAVTLMETIVGFVLGTLVGTLIAVLLWWSETINKILDPYLVVLNSLPKIALGPIIIVWIGAGVSSIIMIALLISLVVTVMSVLNGFQEAGRDKILLMKTFGATKLQILNKVILPSSVSTIISALKINVGMSWIGVIVGEFLVSKAGLGYLIVYGGQVFKLDLVMTGVVILCLLAAIMYQCVEYIEKRYAKRQGL